MIRQLLTQMIHPAVRKESLGESVTTVAKFGQAGPVGAEAAAFSGVGLDLYGGECTLAAIKAHDQPRGYHHISVAALTNRRTIAGGFSSAKGGLNDLAFAAGHDELMSVDIKDSMLKTELTLLSSRGKHSLVHSFIACKDLGKLYPALLGAPAGSRGEPATVVVTPTEADPTGALGAAQALWSADAQTHGMLQRVDQVARAGSYSTQDGQDLAGRVVLMHRARLMGPAAYGMAFLSPLSADDFGNVLVQAMGQPQSWPAQQPGPKAMEFAIVPGRDPLSPALKALGIASFIGLGIGFSPGRMIAAQMLAKEPLRAVRVVYGDVQGGCSYELYGNGHTPLHRMEGMTAHGLHQVLIHHAAPVLQRRAEYGWSPPYAQLWG